MCSQGLRYQGHQSQEGFDRVCDYFVVFVAVVLPLLDSTNFITVYIFFYNFFFLFSHVIRTKQLFVQLYFIENNLLARYFWVPSHVRLRHLDIQRTRTNKIFNQMPTTLRSQKTAKNVVYSRLHIIILIKDIFERVVWNFGNIGRCFEFVSFYVMS